MIQTLTLHQVTTLFKLRTEVKQYLTVTLFSKEKLDLFFLSSAGLIGVGVNPSVSVGGSGSNINANVGQTSNGASNGNNGQSSSGGSVYFQSFLLFSSNFLNSV